MTADLSVDELNIDANTAPVLLDGAFKHVTNSKLFADLLDVNILALEGERRVARNDEGTGDARKVSCESLGNAVCEVVLAGIAGEVGEGQHSDGKMRGGQPGRFWCGFAGECGRCCSGSRLGCAQRGRFRAAREIPSRAASDKDQRCDCGD